MLGLSHHELDVSDRDAVRRAVGAARPDVIVHLAAYTAVDRAQVEEDRCFAVNAAGTEAMSLAAKEYGAHLIAISTDYVFDGNKGASYVEDDVTNPLNVYGASKRAGELLCSSDDTIVRTSWVMGVRGKNVVHVIAERAKSGETVRFVNDQTGTVTVASDLARALATFVRERPGGTWHVANAGTTTWFDVAHFVGERCGRGDDFATAIATSELDPAPLAIRPIRSDLATEKFAGAWSGAARVARRRGSTRARPRRALRGPSMSDVATDVAAVIVDFHAGQALDDCVDSLHANGVTDIVVVENGEEGSTLPSLSGQHVVLVVPKLNLGIRARRQPRRRGGTQAGAICSSPIPTWSCTRGGGGTRGAILDEHPNVGIVGPEIVRPDGTRLSLAARLSRTSGSPVCTRCWRRFGPRTPPRVGTVRRAGDGTVDWVSGAFFLVRRDVFEAVGGFDERYFMFAEDMALCWQIREHGYGVAATPRRAGDPYRGRFARAGARARCSSRITEAPCASNGRRRAGGDGSWCRSRPWCWAYGSAWFSCIAPHDLKRRRLECSLGCEWFCG